MVVADLQFVSPWEHAGVDALCSVELEKQACIPSVAMATHIAKMIRFNIVVLPLVIMMRAWEARRQGGIDLRVLRRTRSIKSETAGHRPNLLTRGESRIMRAACSE